MFKELNLKATYSSYEDDLANVFYNPVLSKSIKYDRATAYFSSKALASYSKGLECFAKNGSHFRLIVSTQISEYEFEDIRKGYEYRSLIDNTLLPLLREQLSLDEERSISNLAFLISLGVIDVKIAFTKKGIFHDKLGIVQDFYGNIICFRGSNNETQAAIDANYEAFDITCSWQASEFDYSKITKSQEDFEKMWNNEYPSIIVKELDDVLMSEIKKHNKGQIIDDCVFISNDCVIIDYDNDALKIEIKENLDPNFVWRGRLERNKFKNYLNKDLCTDRVKSFYQGLSYLDFKKIIAVMKKEADRIGYNLYISNRLQKYINSKEIHIYELSRVAIDIKNHDEKVLSQFEKYKSIVDCEMSRQLREQQMWDSFFMSTLKKSANFSVPGSGKTAAVLGVFAYLRSQNAVEKIVMIGPKNSFGSWIDEFKLCFGDKIPLHCFNIQDYSDKSEKENAISFGTGGKNLLLFNFESISNYAKYIANIIDSKTLLVIDEVHKVKRIDGERANAVMSVTKNANHIIVLTGTPIPNSYSDIYNMLKILYGEEYNEFFGFTQRQLSSPSQYDIEEINEKLQPFYCRTTKEQLQVPSANPDEIISVRATEIENKIFEILLKAYGKNKLALFIRLLQLESNPKMLLKNIDEDLLNVLDVTGDFDDIDFYDFSDEAKSLIDEIESTTKYSLCLQKAKELYSQGKTSIIWCIFVDSINRLEKDLNAMGIKAKSIHGSVSSFERDEILSDFRNGKLDVLITNPHTLAESVSLHKVCHDAIYFEYSYNLVHLLQSKDRIHRLGLPEDQYTQYFYLQQIFNNQIDDFSIDEQVYDRLKEKETIMLNAIENNVLEESTSSQEDLDIVFKQLGL